MANVKKILKFIITKILVFKAKQYLKTHRTQVIAITGSIGKTSTKEAMYHILKSHFKTYKSPGGFNTEIGLCLSILQEEESGFSSALSWLKILKRVFFGKKKPFEKVILEMGADSPGDIKKLVNIANPKIGVITNVNPVHLGEGQFKDLEDIKKEKGSLIKKMGEGSLAILNFDDPLVKNMETYAQKIFYGATAKSDAKSDVFAFDIEQMAKNLKFKIRYQNEARNFKVPVLGNFQIYTLLPAIAVALKLGLSLKDCAKALKDYKTPPSRLSYIPGINGSDIIDSSYNSSPTSTAKVLDLLSGLKAERKIAALGTMNELGEISKEAHLKLGKKAKSVADVLLAVGTEATNIKQGAVDAGMDEKNVYTFFDSEEAGHFLEKFIQPKDLILVKGSQNRVRMEKLVKIIMNEPKKAKKLLCRQGEGWEKS